MSMSKIGVRRVLAWTMGALLAATPVAAQIGEPVEEERECTCIEDLRAHTDGLRIHAGELREHTEGLRKRMEEMRQRVHVRGLPSRPGRARLGVMLGDDVEENGRYGVRLEDVMEGSPAHRAGLRAADVIVGVNDTTLGEDAAEDVLGAMADVEPGDTVRVAFLREGGEHTVQVVTEDAPHYRVLVERMAPIAPGAPGVYAPARPSSPRAPGLHGERIFRHLRPVGFAQHGLELAAVNADLGEYFGTDRGVLVTAVDEESSLGLEPGDVILAIGGRDVEDPAHVYSILASYRSDEEIRLQVVRERRTIDVTGRS